ncbi:MAG: methyl-accepting chemotaxis protein [Gammaproteobacteria bacterium]
MQTQTLIEPYAPIDADGTPQSTQDQSSNGRATPEVALDLRANPRPSVTGNSAGEPHWLIGNDNLGQAFWIAGSLFALPIAAMLYFTVTELTSKIDFADKERMGAEYIAPLVRFQRAVIDYRTGLVSPPAADGTVQATEADLTAGVERAAQEAAEIDRIHGGVLRVGDVWDTANRDWTRIKSGMQDNTRAERVAAIDALVDRIRKSIQDVADSSNLTLDPEIHTYYLMDTVSQKVPQALRFLGDGRDAGLASGDSAAPADLMRFRLAVNNAAETSDQIGSNVKRAVGFYVPLDQTVGPAVKKAQDAIERVVRFAETGIPQVEAPQPDAPGNEISMSPADPAPMGGTAELPAPQSEPSAAVGSPGSPRPDTPTSEAAMSPAIQSAKRQAAISQAPQTGQSTAPLPAGSPRAPATPQESVGPLAAPMPVAAATPLPSGTPYVIRDVTAWREANEQAVETLALAAAESVAALQGLLKARVTDLNATLWMRVVFAAGFCLIAVLALRILGGNQVKMAQLRNREAARLAAENESNQKSILRLMDELAEISQGNLAARTTVTPEITGAIADSINVTVSELYGVVTGIDAAAKEMTGATDEAREVAAGLAMSARAQSTQIKDAATAVQLMTQSITEVAETATRSSDVARHALDAAETGAQAVRSSITNMESIRAQIQETAKRIKRLGESSQEVGEIVGLISDITEQTNVLALNAAIQAASAGEAGRGFTVVAEEVQRLAERSATATNEIATLVKTIQADTQDATTAMEQSTQKVVEGTRLSDSAGSALIDIERVSRDLADLVQSIFVSTQMQTEIAQGVSANIGGILDATDKTTSGSGYIARAMNQLAETANLLKLSVARFRL